MDMDYQYVAYVGQLGEKGCFGGKKMKKGLTNQTKPILSFSSKFKTPFL